MRRSTVFNILISKPLKSANFVLAARWECASACSASTTGSIDTFLGGLESRFCATRL